MLPMETETTTIHLKLTITVEHPKGSTITLAGGAPAVTASTEPATAGPTSVETYFLHFLSDNGRRVFRAAAELDVDSEKPYSLEQIAERVGMTYASVQSMHRSTGRTAKRWRSETGLDDPPFALEWKSYDELPDGGGRRTYYRLTDGAAEQILRLAED